MRADRNPLKKLLRRELDMGFAFEIDVESVNTVLPTMTSCLT